MQKSKTYFFMTIPAIIIFFFFHTLPTLQGIYYSFTNWDGMVDSYDFVGFKNYLNMLSDERILHAYYFTFKFALLTTVIVNIIGLAVAMGLNAKIHLKNTMRGLYFLPYILSVLIVGYIFKYIFSNIVTSFGEAWGIDFLATNLVGREDWAWLGVVIVAVWQTTAFNMILYLAGLQTIQADLYEAASIDGAGKWQRFWKITFPMIAPFFTINMVMSMRNNLMVFDQIMALTQGGPGRITESISIVIYRGGLSAGEFAYQSANAVVFFIIIAILSFLQIKYWQRREIDM